MNHLNEEQRMRATHLIHKLRSFPEEQRSARLKELFSPGDDPIVVNFVSDYVAQGMSLDWRALERDPGQALLTPELRQWALDQLDEERIASQLKELREGDGQELGAFIKDLEETAESHERPGT
ncbi:MAG: hypothetical protein HYS12_14515 [Planctomycetes bacterium]|nr:hypothetical protein [Planctomycetota bacterium]